MKDVSWQREGRKERRKGEGEGRVVEGSEVRKGEQKSEIPIKEKVLDKNASQLGYIGLLSECRTLSTQTLNC